jgi:hypothetical protein
MDNKDSDVAIKVESSTAILNKDFKQGKQQPDSAVKNPVKEEKIRKKDDKSVEQVLKALNSLETTEEKLAAMCKKYTDIVDENRKLQLAVKQTEKRMVIVQREKEQLQAEHSKAILTRSRLESLCRELQRQNKAIKDESVLKIREEEEKRKEVSAKFQSTLNELTAVMQQNNEKNSKLRDDNLEITKKFKTVCEQYELREQQVEKVTKQMHLEAQLADAKLAKAKMEMAAEKEILLQEKQQLLVDMTQYQAKCQELQTTEMNLRSQISLYTDKYDEFQNALTRSNEVFGGFKGEMEKMSKKICKLEKETSSWKQRWEKSHQALLEMAADKQQRDGELALATRQLAQLQKLCRTLQAERTSLLAQLKAEGAAKTGDSSDKRDVPLESLQQSQGTVTGIVACPEKADVCCLKPEKDMHGLSAQKEKADTVNQNEENNSPIEEPLTVVTLSVSGQENDELPVAIEKKEGAAVEVTCCVTEFLEEARNRQNSSKEISLNSVAVKSEHVPENVVKSAESTPNNGISDEYNLSQTEKESFVTICSLYEKEDITESHTVLAETKEGCELKSDGTSMVNRAEIELSNEEYSPNMIINGEMSTSAINQTLTCDEELSENKNIAVATVNAESNVLGSGAIDQMPVKVAGADTKKARESTKKRRNKLN